MNKEGASLMWTSAYLQQRPLSKMEQRFGPLRPDEEMPERDTGMRGTHKGLLSILSRHKSKQQNVTLKMALF